MENRYTVAHLRQKVRTNWKLVQEAFQEGYHVIETHWDSLAIFGDTTTTYDCWEDEHSHIGRLVTPTGVASGFMADKVSIRDSLKQYVRLYNGKDANRDAARRSRMLATISPSSSASSLRPNAACQWKIRPMPGCSTS